MSRPGHLFVYGTLLFDEVVRALTGRRFGTRRATLHGFARHAIVRGGRHETYPAIQSQPGGAVHGRLVLDVDEHSMRRIDDYENNPPEYQRLPVRVECDGGSRLPAVTYVASTSLHPFLAGTWSMEQFEQEHLADTLRDLIPKLRREPGQP